MRYLSLATAVGPGQDGQIAATTVAALLARFAASRKTRCHRPRARRPDDAASRSRPDRSDRGENGAMLYRPASRPHWQTRPRALVANLIAGRSRPMSARHRRRVRGRTGVVLDVIRGSASSAR